MILKKVCLIGTSAVGKTSLIARFLSGAFQDKYHTTVGVKTDKKNIVVEGVEMTLMIWDLAGDDDFQRLNMTYLRGSGGFLFVADGTRGLTLDQVIELQGRVASASGPVPCVLALNKSDLKGQWEITDARIADLQAGGWRVVQTSAKLGSGVEEAFGELGRLMLPPKM